MVTGGSSGAGLGANDPDATPAGDPDAAPAALGLEIGLKEGELGCEATLAGFWLAAGLLASPAGDVGDAEAGWLDPPQAPSRRVVASAGAISQVKRC